MLIKQTLYKAAYDAACKRLLANRQILAWIMKSCLEEYKDYPVGEIAQKYIEGIPEISMTAVNSDETNSINGESVQGIGNEDTTVTEGTVTYDIRFLAIVPSSGEAVGLIINVEAQNNFYPGYPIMKRAVYYGSRMLSAQYGTVFTGSHYEKLEKVYTIWVCLNPPQYRENTITRYCIMEENIIGNVGEKREDYDLMAAVMICLGREDGENYSGILKLLEVLLSPEKEPEKKILEEDFEIEMTTEIQEECCICAI